MKRMLILAIAVLVCLVAADVAQARTVVRRGAVVVNRPIVAPVVTYGGFAAPVATYGGVAAVAAPVPVYGAPVVTYGGVAAIAAPPSTVIVEQRGLLFRRSSIVVFP